MCCKGGSFSGGATHSEGAAAKCQPGCPSSAPHFGDISEPAGAGGRQELGVVAQGSSAVPKSEGSCLSS